MKFEEFRAPLTVTWDVTYSCNLRCRHCIVDAGNPLQGELSIRVCKEIVDEMAELGVFKVGFAGGEPFMRKGFFELLKYSNMKGIDTSISTNGTLITKSVARKLTRVGVSAVQFSVDGVGATHDNFRGVSGAFDKTVRGIVHCIQVGVPLVAVETVVTRINIAQVPLIIDLALSLKVSQYIVTRLKPYGRGKSLSNEQLTTEEYRELMTFLERKRKDLDSLEIVLTGGCSFMPQSNEATPCAAGRTGLSITPIGDITPCAFLPMRLGNIRQELLETVWNNAAFFKHIRNLDNLKGKCRRCTYKNSCGKCLALSYFYSGDAMSPDPMCWYDPPGDAI